MNHDVARGKRKELGDEANTKLSINCIEDKLINLLDVRLEISAAM